jgi:hypothetical protein
VAGLAYVLCSATAFLCSWLLFRAYATNGLRLLFWSGVCFSLLTLSNLILVLDRLVYPDLDLSVLRQLPGLAGLIVLLYALIWQDQ